MTTHDKIASLLCAFLRTEPKPSSRKLLRSRRIAHDPEIPVRFRIPYALPVFIKVCGRWGWKRDKFRSCHEQNQSASKPRKGALRFPFMKSRTGVFVSIQCAVRNGGGSRGHSVLRQLSENLEHPAETGSVPVLSHRRFRWVGAGQRKRGWHSPVNARPI